MYFINCFIYTINKILKFKVVLLSLYGSDCSVVVIENVLLSTSRIPCAHFGHLIYFPRFFTRESVVRVGRRESKCLHLLHREEESALEEALRVSISLLMLLLFLCWFLCPDFTSCFLSFNFYVEKVSIYFALGSIEITLTDVNLLELCSSICG